MKKIAMMVTFSIIFFSCTKDLIIPGDEFNIQGTAKIKTKYIYSSSSENEPYAFISYTYDDNWNLKKELISDNPKPVYASYTYDYSNTGVLINKKYKAKEGNNYSDQTESEFSLIREYKYSYPDNKKIEKEYRNNELTDSVIYSYANSLLISEYHYDLENDLDWSIIYEYDSNNKLIKETSNPEGTYAVNSYEGSRITKTSEYDRNGSFIDENEFIYIKSEDKVIVETHHKVSSVDFLSDKTTYRDGNVIEYIRYHPTFVGAEWYCFRYEYYK